MQIMKRLIRNLKILFCSNIVDERLISEHVTDVQCIYNQIVKESCKKYENEFRHEVYELRQKVEYQKNAKNKKIKEINDTLKKINNELLKLKTICSNFEKCKIEIDNVDKKIDNIESIIDLEKLEKKIKSISNDVKHEMEDTFCKELKKSINGIENSTRERIDRYLDIQQTARGLK